MWEGVLSPEQSCLLVPELPVLFASDLVSLKKVMYDFN